MESTEPHEDEEEVQEGVVKNEENKSVHETEAPPEPLLGTTADGVEPAVDEILEKKGSLEADKVMNA